MNTAGTLPPLGLAIVGSNTMAVGAELIAQTTGYDEFYAIRRRKNHTALPVLMDCDDWQEKLRRIGYRGAAARIAAADKEIEELVGGRRYDCFLHHHKDLFCQLLASHRLCNRYFYLEEGLTSHIGGRFGAPRDRKLQPFIWKFRNALFYQGRLNIFHPHFKVTSPRYGGAFGISAKAFPDFPKRVLLPFSELKMAEPAPAGVVAFLDYQYVGRFLEEVYTAALVECLKGLLEEPVSVAVKFHPKEKDEERKKRMMAAVAALDNVTGVIELPGRFIGERMQADGPVKVVVGASALGVYLGERGVPVYTFIHRIRELDHVMKSLPEAFREVCIKA